MQCIGTLGDGSFVLRQPLLHGTLGDGSFVLRQPLLHAKMNKRWSFAKKRVQEKRVREQVICSRIGIRVKS